MWGDGWGFVESIIVCSMTTWAGACVGFVVVSAFYDCVGGDDRGGGLLSVLLCGPRRPGRMGGVL